MDFANNLKYLRTAKHIGQKELANILNITVKTISHWETGYCEPSILQLIALSEYFEVSIDELVGNNKFKI